jgi:hypothetical protein
MSDAHAQTTLLDRGFSLTIAFFLPGLITLGGFAVVNETVKSWFSGAQTGPTLVGFLFVLMAALALNLLITALRWFAFEKVRVGRFGPIVPASPSFDEQKRKDFEVQFIDLRHQFYYHYLAYANAAVAVPLAVAAWKFGSTPEPEWSTYLIVCAAATVISVILGLAARDAVLRYDERAKRLIGLVSATS